MGAEIERAVIGIRSRIGEGAQIRDSLVLGADFYETVEEMERGQAQGPAARGHRRRLGDRARHRRQERAHRTRRAHHQPRRASATGTETGYYIRDGIVVVPKNAVIPDGTVV